FDPGGCMRKLMLAAVTALLLTSYSQAQDTPKTTAAEKPLQALPYTPGLDVRSMDKTADPCTDFYQYSCGGWMKNNPIPADQASWSVYGKLAQENEQYLWGVLQDLSAPRADRTAEQQKIGDYFQACMDQSRVNSLGDQPLKPLLAQIAALKRKSGLSKFVATQHPRAAGRGGPSGFGSNQG